MYNRCKSRSFFILFFLIQFILFSTYVVNHYQYSVTDNAVETDKTNELLAPNHLPGSLIEKNHRLLLTDNYRNIDLVQMQRNLHSKINESVDLQNVSLVKEYYQPKTIVQCSLLPTDLIGSSEVDLFSYKMEEVEKHYENSSIELGGHWSPLHCTAHYRVAIVVPYRNRDMQLRIFLNAMHGFLQRQYLDYQIFLVEPDKNVTFNRALLLNIGFREALKHYSWQCFIFHDVDLIPEDDRNIYSCPPEPRHMSAAVNTMNYELPYRAIFGGVSALTVEQFESVNGYSNQFFGWGGEDDDMAARILRKYRISRYPQSIARYKMLRHAPDTPNESRFRILSISSSMSEVDGLNSLQYTLIETQKNKLFTKIRVAYNETSIKATIAHLKRNSIRQRRKKN